MKEGKKRGEKKKGRKEREKDREKKKRKYIGSLKAVNKQELHDVYTLRETWIEKCKNNQDLNVINV